MLPMCSIYNAAAFKTLVEEHELCKRKDLSRKLDPIPADGSYNV